MDWISNFKSRTTYEALLKIVLRSVPIIPAPEVYDLIRSVGKSEKDIDDQIREAFAALSASSALVDRLKTVLQEREGKLKALQAEYARVSTLATLTEDQAKAVADSLEGVLGRSAVKERVIALLINVIVGLAIFALGVFASDWLKGLAT
ncbi:MAG: hypothetical protein EBR82_06740 [Caulobacteraceae bacterium]|nr:hypothetical protein [Caulobacteraceae bacterium]